MSSSTRPSFMQALIASISPIIWISGGRGTQEGLLALLLLAALVLGDKKQRLVILKVEKMIFYHLHCQGPATTIQVEEVSCQFKKQGATILNTIFISLLSPIPLLHLPQCFFVISSDSQPTINCGISISPQKILKIIFISLLSPILLLHLLRCFLVVSSDSQQKIDGGISIRPQKSWRWTILKIMTLSLQSGSSTSHGASLM